MSSAFPGGGPDFYGGGGGRPSIGGIGNNNLILPNNPSNTNTMNQQQQQHPRQALLRLQQQQQQQLLQQQQRQQSSINGGIMNESIANSQIGGGNRRPDFIGKRDFQNFSLFNQPALNQNHQQQQQQRFSLLNQNQNQNQPLSLIQQQQLYFRSVKQRTTNPPNNNINISVNNSNNNTLVNYQNNSSPISSFDLRSSPLYPELSSSPSFSMPLADNTTTRYGVPVYQQHQLRQQQPISLITNNNSNNNNNIMMRNSSNPLGPGYGGFVNNLGGGGGGTGTGGIVGGYESNLGTNRVSSDESKPPESENNNNKILLQELEKQLLDDNDDEVEGDTVSVITNSEWSETFQNLMAPAQAPTAATAQPGGGQTQNSSNNNHQNNNNNNPSPSQNNLISPSPTSSTSSSCSSTAATVPAMQLISDSANAISEGKTESAVEILTRLSMLGNQNGNSEQRMIHYMCSALRSRACPKEHPPAAMELLGKEHMGSMYLFHDLSLCYKFGLFAANLVIMETISIAKQEKSNVHIVDFDIGRGGQYINLLRALGERHHQSQSQSGGGGGGGGYSVELKLTVVTTELMKSIGGVGISSGVDGTVKDMLLNTAERAGVKLRFNAVNQSIRELTPESLGFEENDSLVVNFAFKLYRIPDESVSIENPRDELLRRVKGLKPRVVTLVEQDMNGNTAPFMTRVNECVAYYGALFDSLDCGPARDNPERLRVEEGLGRKMMNSLACEGRDRVERCEVYGKWRARMGMAGFALKPLTQNVAESMKIKINSSRVGDPRFTVKEENGGVCFGWMGRALTVASAWR